MTLPRSERLKVLGLWPLWQLRGQQDSFQEEAPVEAQVEKKVTPRPPFDVPPVDVPPFEPDPRPVAAPAPTPVLESKRGARPFLAALQNGARAAEAQKLAPKPQNDAPTPAATSVEKVQHTDLSDLDWAALQNAVAHCTRCNLHASRAQAVFGGGDLHADWLFVGEAPGAEEDRRGEPFVGQAGQLLDAMLGAIGLDRRKNLYIANVLKSRPPGNHDPKPEQVAACMPYLERQIALIQPKIIVALGRFAAQTLLQTDASISKLRGRVHSYQGIPMLVTYHPAYLLRNLADKSKVWEDLCLARRTMQRTLPGA